MVSDLALKNGPALAIGVLVVSGCTDVCENTEVKREMSGDGKHVAVMYQRDCGATTGFSTQISIIAKNEKLSGGGNTYVADSDHGLAFPGEWGGPWADMQWLSPQHLQVRYADRSRMFEQDDSVSGVRITYLPIEKAPSD